MLTSVQLYSVRDAFTQDPHATLATLRAHGFEQVEPFGLLQHAEALRTALPDLGLSAPSTHQGVIDADDPSRVFGVAAELGITTVIDPFRNPEHWQDADSIHRTADLLNARAQVAAQHGVRLGYHNHDFEVRTPFDGRTGLELLAEALDPRVVLEIDTYWVAVGGVDPAALLRELGQRVQLLHLKDGPLGGNTSQQLPLGQGEMDVPAVLDAAPWVEIGVIEFDDYAGDPLDGVRDSLTHLRTLLAGGEDR